MDFQLTIKILTYLDPVNVSKCQQVVKSNQENLGRYHNVIRMQGSRSHHALEDVVQQAVDVEVADAVERHNNDQTNTEARLGWIKGDLSRFAKELPVVGD